MFSRIIESLWPLQADPSPYAVAKEIDETSLPEQWKNLIREAIEMGTEITVERVIGIWKLAQDRNIPNVHTQILWVENNLPSAGYQHMLKPRTEFEQLGITSDELVEVAEAATSVGYPGGEQGRTRSRPGRPFFCLCFHGILFTVAISVGTNGFVVGMDRSSWMISRKRQE